MGAEDGMTDAELMAAVWLFPMRQRLGRITLRGVNQAWRDQGKRAPLGIRKAKKQPDAADIRWFHRTTPLFLPVVIFASTV